MSSDRRLFASWVGRLEVSRPATADLTFYIRIYRDSSGFEAKAAVYVASRALCGFVFTSNHLLWQQSSLWQVGCCVLLCLIAVSHVITSIQMVCDGESVLLTLQYAAIVNMSWACF